MINYVDEVVDIAKIDRKSKNVGVDFFCVDGKAIVVSNYIKIITYRENRCVLKLKDDELIIDGVDMKIKELNKHDICLVGKIVRVYFAKEVTRYDKAE